MTDTRPDKAREMLKALYRELDRFGHEANKDADAVDEAYCVNGGIVNRHINIAENVSDLRLATYLLAKYQSFYLTGFIHANGKHYYLCGYNTALYVSSMEAIMNELLIIRSEEDN